MVGTTLGFMGTKGLPLPQARHLANLLRPVVEKRFGGNETHAAKAMGVHQSQFNQILKAEGRGAGIAILMRIRKYMRMSIDELLGLEPVRAAAQPAATPALDAIREAVRAELAAIRAEEARAPLEEEPDPPTPPPVARPVRKRGSA
jgi:transcriptional regulator with XRE-family HTH domain